MRSRNFKTTREKDLRPYFIKFCEGLESLNVIKFFTTICDHPELSQTLLSLNSPEGNKTTPVFNQYTLILFYIYKTLFVITYIIYKLYILCYIHYDSCI